MTNIDIKPFLGTSASNPTRCKLGTKSYQNTAHATVYVHDQAGTPIPGASVTITDGYTGIGGVTDANGYYVSPDLPFPTPMGFSGYMVIADYYTATSQASAGWGGDAGVIDLMLPLSTLMSYDITVIAYQGGTTNPAPGHLTGQGIITVTAIPNSGYVFDHWNQNGSFLTSSTSFHTGATGTFEAYFTPSAPTPPPPPPPTAAVGKITAIRIQDVARHLWYSWDNGTWDNAGGAAGNAPVGQTPYITPGANNLYIAFYATNQGGSSGNLVLTINDSTGAIIATKTVVTPAGGTAGIEWTGTMPTSPYVLSLSVNP